MRGDYAVARDRFEIGWGDGTAGRPGRPCPEQQLAKTRRIPTVALDDQVGCGRSPTATVQLARNGIDVRAALGSEEHADVERGGPADELPHARNRRRMTGELERIDDPPEAGGRGPQRGCRAGDPGRGP